MFCSEIVNPYDLVTMYIVTVPEAEHAQFDEEFARFAQARGLTLTSGSLMLQELGGTKRFLNLNSTACDGITFVWSSNVAVADEFVVTFHSNWLFGSRRAEIIRDAFVSEFRSHYRIETEDSDFKRHPVR